MPYVNPGGIFAGLGSLVGMPSSDFAPPPPPGSGAASVSIDSILAEMPGSSAYSSSGELVAANVGGGFVASRPGGAEGPPSLAFFGGVSSTAAWEWVLLLLVVLFAIWELS